MRFIRNKDLGLDKEHIINLRFPGGYRSEYETLKAELLQYPNIINITSSNFSPFGSAHQSVWWEGLAEDEDPMMHWFPVDYDFIKTFNIDLIDGRAFSAEYPSDVNTNYILNESAVKMIGWDTAVGKQFQVLMAGNTLGTVVGVIKDFHFRSLHHHLQPLVLYLLPNSCNQVSLKITANNVNNTVQNIEKAWQRIIPNYPFEFRFFDETLNSLYKYEQKSIKMLAYFAILSIFIACLGLFGLASFVAEQSTKAIGIRKILGATIPDIMKLMTKNFALLILLSNLIAWPIAYIVMNKMLNSFAYRTPIGIWVFLSSGMATIIIALLTVGFRSLKTAVKNPVDTLRYE